MNMLSKIKNSLQKKPVVFIPAFRSSFLPNFEKVFIVNHLVLPHNGGSVVLVQQKPQSLWNTTVNHLHKAFIDLEHNI